MNKKGTHVDWVISMGIFIIYIFALFILLRPGIKPAYKPVTLLDNLERNFEKDVMWTVKMVPLFIRECSGGSETDGYSSFSVDDKANSWSLSIIKDPDLPDKIFPNNRLECNLELNFIRSTKSVGFEFYFYGSGVPVFEIDTSCRSETPAEDCVGELGVVEDIKGINEGELDKLRGDYDILKEEWNIPEDKGFAILADNDEIVGGKPGEQDNVFVRKLTTQYVEQDGDTQSVAIYLQIW